MDATEIERLIRGHVELETGDDPDFDAMMDDILNFGELRIYRAIPELLGENTRLPSVFTLGSREIAIPVAMFSVKGLSFTTGGVTTPLLPVSMEFIDNIWPARATVITATSQLQYWTPKDNDTVLVAGTPAAGYTAEFFGLVREDPLSSTNPETYLSEKYPDLLLASCLMYAFGYERDYGSQADDPQAAMSWKGVFGELLPGVITQEERLAGRGPGWQNQAPTPLATPPRE